MIGLRVLRLRFVGRADSQVYEFPRRVTVITGPVGVGKSSMLNAIKYGLGGNWTIPRKIRGAVDAVELDVRIGEEQLKLSRRVQDDRGTVELRVRGAGVQLLPIEGGEDELTVSRFLLMRLGIPDLQVTESTARPGERLTTITFNDVMQFMYLDQDQIDGVVGFTGDIHRKWRQTFEVLYALSDADVAALRIELGGTNSDYDRAVNYLRDARRFLAAAELSETGPTAERHERVGAELAGIDRELARARQGLATPVADQHRAQLSEVEFELVRRRELLATQKGQLGALERVASQLRTDAANVERAMGALVLREMEFELCPRCLKDLPPPVSDGSCRLCHQPDEQQQATSIAAEIERRRCERQLAETRVMIADTREASEQVAVELVALNARRAELQEQWNTASAAAIAPAAEELERLGQQRGRLVAEGNELRDAARLAGELSAAEAERSRLAAEQLRLKEELAAAEAARQRGRDTLQALSDRYGRLLQEMELPNMEEGGSVHPKRYVPLVDGELVKAQSSGGLKTMANFAYFLAALELRLAGYPTYLPALMMIDSPRKNHGANEDDLASMERCYRVLATLLQQRRKDFQVIVADNDSPGADRERFAQIRLSRENKLIDIARLQGDGDGSA